MIPRDLPPASRDRLEIWGLCQLASSGEAPEESLFRSPGKGTCYTLRPEPRSAVPLQRFHIGPGAISDELADTPCTDVAVVVDTLNAVMGTAYTLDRIGVRDLVEYAMRLSRDFGEVYGRVRQWWNIEGDPWLERSPTAHLQLLSRMIMCRSKDGEERRVMHADHDPAVQSDLPPRRVWDLYSNRVLPYHNFRDSDMKKRSALGNNEHHLHQDCGPCRTAGLQSRTAPRCGQISTASGGQCRCRARRRSRTFAWNSSTWVRSSCGSTSYACASRAERRTSRPGSRSGRRTYRQSDRSSRARLGTDPASRTSTGSGSR
ncbi:hypothetical protein PsYK624_114240 [Phanerochaete sordida]|uniref:Uncharacterized protein n=1 Tax=Phanerochaete sordida TaxID=48140 RepID=A0A9P3GGL7_9APHY|nr:hypothetical protein PsYK624_114240 [Phanerochaete sordida]